MKRVLDLTLSAAGLVAASLPLIVVLLLVWLQDRRNPLYRGERIGRHGKPFRMAKVRSMVVGADRSGVESTSASDLRITPLGHAIRRMKFDELPQLWNVLRGQMSLVGPRPNTAHAVADYSSRERALLAVRPGITDISSIVFSDEGEIIKGFADPDEAYNRLIRPWKSDLGLLYVEQSSVGLDMKLIWLTIVAVLDKRAALRRLGPLLVQLGAPDLLIDVCRREIDLAWFAAARQSQSI